MPIPRAAGIFGMLVVGLFGFVGASHGAGQDAAPPPGATASRLDANEIRALTEALDDEYRAWATYDQVLRDFGPVRPFLNIREAEARHVEALRTVFRRYAVDVPENSWPGRVPRFASVREACGASIEAEIANDALYRRLLRSTSRPDIVAVFRNLQSASRDHHLPAFRRCAARGSGPPTP